MSDSVKKKVDQAIEANDVEKVRSLFKANPNLLESGGSWLYDAAYHGHLQVVKALVQLGIDVNSPRFETDPGLALGVAASEGHLDVARWLLANGADVNKKIGSGSPIEMAAGSGSVEMVKLLLDHNAKVDSAESNSCPPLASAATSGHLEIVRLLLERGADPNVLYGTMEYGDPPRNALLQATMFGHDAVADLLRAHGAVMPSDFKDHFVDGVLQHIQNHIGIPEPLSLHEVVQGDPPITIYAVPMDWCVALVTSGMSERAMTVPKGGEAYRYAELIMYLPEDWPLSQEDLSDPDLSWPIEWLLRVAHFPHENNTWLGGVTSIIANGEPPMPLARNTNLSCWLAITEDSEFGVLQLDDERMVNFYTLYPLYTEERDLEKKRGTKHILELFQKHQISKTLDINRPNVAIRQRRGRK